MQIVTFGEIMMRLAPSGRNRFLQADALDVTYGGAEANVAVGLSMLGVKTRFVSRVPQNNLGQAALNAVGRYGVGTDFCARGGERLGLYFVEKGAAQRAGRVVYDRAHSAFATCSMDEFRWEDILKDVQWFHFSGVTPALSDNTYRVCLDALRTARKLGISVSCDMNYRANLWTKEDAREKMASLFPYVTHFISNEWQANALFSDCPSKRDTLCEEEHVRAIANMLVETYGFQSVALTVRESLSADDNVFSAMLYDGKTAVFSRKYPVHIVDRVGAGDAFSAGLIYALTHDDGQQRTIEFAAAAGCLKHSVEGDFNLVTAEEISALCDGVANGMIKR